MTHKLFFEVFQVKLITLWLHSLFYFCCVELEPAYLLQTTRRDTLFIGDTPPLPLCWFVFILKTAN